MKKARKIPSDSPLSDSCLKAWSKPSTTPLNPTKKEDISVKRPESNFQVFINEIIL